MCVCMYASACSQFSVLIIRWCLFQPEVVVNSQLKYLSVRPLRRKLTLMTTDASVAIPVVGAQC